ncbi:MAG TPA: transposase, partial [Streptosporangiaceae bacterium]|nr:transposase [Streptosporangiaceae bacterium]
GHLGIIIDALDGDADGQQIAAVWIAKEQLRALLALRITKTHVSPAPSQVRDKLASFYAWCADHQHIPELKTLAATITKWQQPVIDAVLTGYSNAKAEAHNRTAKMVARTARGFANPENQARRVRMATTRGARLGIRRPPRRRSRNATGPP